MDESTSKEVKVSGMIQELELQANWLRTRCAQLAAELAHAVKIGEEHLKELTELKKVPDENSSKEV